MDLIEREKLEEYEENHILIATMAARQGFSGSGGREGDGRSRQI